MVAEMGFGWVMVGHSERRARYGETDADTGLKVEKALAAGLRVIIAIGESLEEREGGKTDQVNQRQLSACIPYVRDWDKVVIAYEPVWAIGTGKVATPAMAQETHAAIRKFLSAKVGPEVAASVRIQYGGSASPDNCAELIAQPDIDGFLVGGASLKPTFTKMITTCAVVRPSTMIYQLGTNNWQRLKNDGTGELEFAPGSGVLHEAHHNAYNKMPGIKSYSMYPSKNQAQPTEANADYRVFELDHDIPICESASPNSSKRWHGFSDEEFSAYMKRMENDVYDHMLKCEEKEGTKFTCFIAHHSFINPLVGRNVIQRRAKEGISPPIPIYCFVHGTALKMYRWELGPKETDEQKQFPMRFHSMMKAEKLFSDQVNGINACFVISTEQKGGIAEIFPEFPQDRVIVAPNGINVEKFKPREKTLEQVVVQQTRNLIWPAVPSEDEVKKYKRVVVFVGKYAEWKRQAALLYAASAYETKFPDVATLCAGIGPDAEIAKIKALCEELGLKNTFLLGARSQDELAEMYTVTQMGVFPSFKEPFGLVFVECMACKAPVIGANSGGPKDFVSPEVGELVAEPPETTDLSTVPLGVKTLGKTLDETISRALNENWKEKKGAACIKLAHDRFTVAAQVAQMLKDIQTLG
jgi:glycosyltransferase involved in cell wall biosynthesis